MPELAALLAVVASIVRPRATVWHLAVPGATGQLRPHPAGPRSAAVVGLGQPMAWRGAALPSGRDGL